MDSSHAFAISDSGNVIATTDVGESWRVVTRPFITENPINAIFFTSPTNGYVTQENGLLRRTTDEERAGFLVSCLDCLTT